MSYDDQQRQMMADWDCVSWCDNGSKCELQRSINGNVRLRQVVSESEHVALLSESKGIRTNENDVL